MSIRDWFRSRDYGYEDFINYKDFIGSFNPASDAFSSDAVIVDGIHFLNTEAAINHFERKKDTTMTDTTVPCEHEFYTFVYKRNDLRELLKCANVNCGMVFTDRYVMIEHAERKTPAEKVTEPKAPDPTYTDEQFAAVHRIMRNTQLRNVSAKEIENHLSYTQHAVKPEQLNEILSRMVMDGVLESIPVLGDSPNVHATFTFKPCTRSHFPRPHMKLLQGLDTGELSYFAAKELLKNDYRGYPIQQLGIELLHLGIVEITETYDERKGFASIERILNEKESTIRYTPEIENPPHVF